MSINFDSLAKPRVVVVPVRKRRFRFENKAYTISTRSRCADGWAEVMLHGNSVEWLRAVCEHQLPKQRIYGYTHADTIVFAYSDEAKRKWNFGLSAPLHFNQAGTFEPVIGVVWEDLEVYYSMPNYSDMNCNFIKDIFDKEEALADYHGLTASLRTLFLFHSIERDNVRAILKEAAEKKDLADRLKTLPGRLQHTFERSGAILLNFATSGHDIVVDWKLKDGHDEFNSVIDASTFMVKEAGYCMSGDDKRHNITSLVKTVEDYEERSLVHITRS